MTTVSWPIQVASGQQCIHNYTYFLIEFQDDEDEMKGNSDEEDSDGEEGSIAETDDMEYETVSQIHLICTIMVW